MIQTQRDLQCIENKDDNPLAAVKALMGYHQITNDLAALIDLLPYVAGGSSYKVGNDRLTFAGDQQQSEKTSTKTEATTRRTNNSVF
jgi:hypothetical protein